MSPRWSARRTPGKMLRRISVAPQAAGAALKSEGMLIAIRRGRGQGETQGISSETEKHSFSGAAGSG